MYYDADAAVEEGRGGKEVRVEKERDMMCTRDNFLKHVFAFLCEMK